MVARAICAFLALPGVVALLAPLALLRFVAPAAFRHPSGVVPLAAGLAALLWCTRDFLIAGKGTLAPWAPPVHLVTTGLYRYSRNPMYVAVVLMLVGWAIAFASVALAVYAGAVLLAFQLRVVHGEEPWLAAVHGEQWRQYVARVPRWLW